MLKRSLVFLPAFDGSRSLFLFFVLDLADRHALTGLFCKSRNSRKLNDFVGFPGLKSVLTVKTDEFSNRDLKQH